MATDLTGAIRAWQAASDYYGEAQHATADASEKFFQATEAEKTAHRALLVAQQQLLDIAYQTPLPKGNAAS